MGSCLGVQVLPTESGLESLIVPIPLFISLYSIVCYIPKAFPNQQGPPKVWTVEISSEECGSGVHSPQTQNPDRPRLFALGLSCLRVSDLSYLAHTLGGGLRLGLGVVEFRALDWV